ncbi:MULTISPECIES: hypothetical protein [Pseudomonas syringae group]|uniref:hypothetical protein n=1 Tax=Pseudomonas syringae group TaxID=136849 RepID=UPI000F008BFC|nr:MULTISPECIES: hypothetical protein [Pseudomonas syringae group]MDH4602418.1 hypothetical protein [Pseudomonas syringae pv. papulans]
MSLPSESPSANSQLKIHIAATQSVGLAALPSQLRAAVESLKVSTSLLHTLGTIEQVSWEEHLKEAKSRATALTFSAMVYGDLSHEDWIALDEHIKDRLTKRRAECLTALVSEI